MKSISSNIVNLEEEKLKEYIKKELNDGFSLNEVKKALIQAGHPIEYIDRAIREIELEKQQKSKKEQEADKEPTSKTGNISGKQTTIEVTSKEKISKSAGFPKTKNKFYNLTFNKKILIGVITLIIIGLFIFLAFNSLLKPESKKQSNDELNNDIKLLIKAGEHDDVSYCARIKNHNLYYDCYDKIWLQDDSCKFQEITGLKADECYSNLAVKNKDLNICFDAHNNDVTKRCLQISFNRVDAQECADFLPCLEYWFEKNQNNDICGKIMELKKKDDCYETYAILSSDGSVCNLISNRAQKEKCIFDLLPIKDSRKLISEENFILLVSSSFYEEPSKYKTNDCPYFNFSEYYIDKYFKEDYIAINNNNPDDKKFLAVDTCCCMISIKKDNESICNHIKSGNLKKICSAYFIKNCESLINNENLYNICKSFLEKDFDDVMMPIKNDDLS